ncbi:MAG: LysM peptidoglycan-binding domain-containing protein [Clostridiaceae bacterium]|nr:LysM peptidoglycan-binding domain-containing protein [Clostridiaceae bacterium]
MYGLRKKTKSAVIAVLALAMLVVIALPMNVLGKSSYDGEYQYYVIKYGDTLTRISSSFGVSISDIMAANNIKNADLIYAGNVIKVPLSADSPSANGWSSTTISLELENANVQDALSAVALNAGYTIIFVDNSNATVTLKLEQVSALKAVDYITRLADLSFIKDGNTLIVGTADQINSKFVDKVVMHKFTLNYITVDVLQAQASALGLENVQYVVTEQDDSTVYISAYPKELAKLQELIKILDVSSNITAGGTLVPENFKYIDLTYIDATEFSGLLGNLGLETGIVLPSRPYTLYTFATGAAFADIQKIKAIVDKPLTGKNLEAANGGSVTDETVNNNTTNNTTNNNTNTDSDSTTTTNNSQILREISLTYIDRATAVDIVNSFPYSVTVYGPEKMTKKIWLMGTEDEVNKAENKIKEFDTEDYADSQKLENQCFVYDLENCTAQEMLDRLQNIDLGDVTFKTNSYPTVSKSLMVYCEPSRQDQIKSLLASLDVASSSESEYRAIEVAASEAVGSGRIEALREVHPEIPASAEFKFVTTTDKTGGTIYCTTYVRGTAETAEYIKALLNELDTGN